MALKVRDCIRMAQKPLNPVGGEAPHIMGRVAFDQATWFNEICRQVGGTRSDVLRRALAVARKHEEELLEVS